MLRVLPKLDGNLNGHCALMGALYSRHLHQTLINMITPTKYTHTYSDGSKASEYVLETQHGIVTIDPEGGYVTSWKVKHPHSHEYFDILYRGSTKKRSGIPILFPYFGKSNKTRQHGFGRDST